MADGKPDPKPPPADPKMDPKHGDGHRGLHVGRVICTFIAIFLLICGIIILIVWLVYRPYKPRFTVVGAAVYNLTATPPPFISATMQFTIEARNPNKRVSLHYDRLVMFVTYRNEYITQPVGLPPLHQKKHSTVAFSPVLGGDGLPVPVSPDVANGLLADQAYGVVGVRLVLLGRLRYKAGAIRTRRHRLDVRCDVLLGLRNGVVGQLPLLGDPNCRVDV